MYKIFKNHILLFVLFFIVIDPVKTMTKPVELVVEQHRVIEWVYESSKDYPNPFRDIELDVLITTPNGKKIKVPSFWAGDNEWHVRFSAQEMGKYTFVMICSDKRNKNLHNKKGNITVVPYEGNNPLYMHGPLKISSDKRHLEHNDGSPFLWLADSWWHGMTQRFKWPEDFKTLTADRKEKGFNVIQFTVGFPCDISPFDPRGQNEAGDPWIDSTFTSINPAYFNLTDERIEWLMEQGMMPNILGSWGYYMKWMGVDKMKLHWRYLIARYGAYPITWTLSGETTLAYYSDLGSEWEFYRHDFREKWSEVARYIQETDTYNRLLTTHPGPGVNVDGKPAIYDMDQLDFIMVQSGHGGFQSLERATNGIKKHLIDYPDKPVLHGEVCFEGMQGRSLEDVQRFLFWSNMMLGTAGFSYGVEGIWQFNTEEELFGASPAGNTWGNVPWETAYNYSGSKQVGIGKRILEQYKWWTLKPAPELIETSGKGIFAPYSAVIGDDCRIIYMHNFPASYRSSRIIQLEGNYRVTYHDPITGDMHDFGIIKPDDQGKWELPTPPVMQEWVIVLKRI
jgi:hypothetical protein